MHSHIDSVGSVMFVERISRQKKMSYMYSHLDSVGSVMFVERSLRHQETHAKKH